MNFDSTKHITHQMLAAAAGITSSSLSNYVKSGNCPQSAGSRKDRRGNRSSFYDRTEALLWAAQINPPPAGEIVPPSDINLMQRGTWTPKGTLADNFARAAQVYPHRLVTPQGVGNDHNYRGRA